MRYAEARRIALEEVKKTWGIGTGDPYAAREGWEDRDTFAVPVNSREYLVNGDKRFMVLDAPIVLVDKDTGFAVPVQFLDAEEQISAMRPVTMG